MASVLESLLRDLISTRPASRDANRIKAEIEHFLMKKLKKDGLRGVEQAMARLNARGWALSREHGTGSPQTGYGLWRQAFGGGQRLLEVSAHNARGLQTTSVQYRKIIRGRMTRRQRELFSLHVAFYTLYNEIARRAYAVKPAQRLRPADRLVLLIAELEADVQNGGFVQYLDNKGRRRARSALAALQKVGAQRTRAMLAAALSGKITDAQFGKLDEKFCRSPEDLAALVMRHIALSATGVQR